MICIDFLTSRIINIYKKFSFPNINIGSNAVAQQAAKIKKKRPRIKYKRALSVKKKGCDMQHYHHLYAKPNSL